MTIFQLLYKTNISDNGFKRKKKGRLSDPSSCLSRVTKKRKEKYGLLVKLIIKEHAFRVNIGYEAVFPVIRQKTEIREPGTGTFFADPIVLES